MNKNNDRSLKPHFKMSKCTLATLIITIALLLVCVLAFNSNWQLSFGLKTSVDNGRYEQNDNNDSKDLVIDNAVDNGYEVDDEFSEEDQFLYALIYVDLLFMDYDVFPAIVNIDGKEIRGFAISSYKNLYTDDDKNEYFEASFISLLDEDVLQQSDIEDHGVVLNPIKYSDNEEDNLNYIVTFGVEFENHYVAFEHYYYYKIKDFKIKVDIQEKDEKLFYTALGKVYDYDISRIVYDPDLGAEFNPPGYSLNQFVDYELVKNSYKAFIAEQTLNGMRADSISTAYISMEAFNDFLANNQQESFLGLEPEEIYNIQANISNSLFYYVDSDGQIQILELPPDPADKATIWERIGAAIASIAVIVAAIVIATATMITTAGTMSVAGSMLIGAAIGFGVEFFMQVTVNGTPLKDVDWAKVAVSTLAGALSAVPGMGWLGAGLINGGSQAAYAWLDGADFEEVLLAFGIGFATGVVIHFATKALSKITSKIENKLSNCFVAGTQVLALNANNEIVTKNIEDIKKGDTVVTYNELSGEMESNKVAKAFRSAHDELIKVTTSDDQVISSSVEHPYYVQNKNTWIEAKDLRAGDILKTVNGKKVVVEQVQHEILEKTEALYNFEVEENHDYFVGENATVDFDSFVLVHNACKIEIDKGLGGVKYVAEGKPVKAYKQPGKFYLAEDFSGHGGVAYKKLKEVAGNKIKLIGDSDKFGNIIVSKHSSNAGVPYDIIKRFWK